MSVDERKRKILRGKDERKKRIMRKNVKKLAATALSLVMLGSVLTGCGGNADAAITVVSREDGSGTRGAFTELMGIMVDDKDNTVSTAEVTNSTSVMMTTVAGDENAIGYISLGSLDDSVKAVKVDGVEPTVEDIKNGSYKVARPFEICIPKDGTSEVAQDFIDYMLSDDGQKIISDEGYISVESGKSYEASGKSGKITLAGSTSVSPVMEKLTEAYKKLNPDVTTEIQQTGSSAGIESATEGACDIGMSSRELKPEELDALQEIQIAMDGICVIVNNNSSVEDLTSDQITKVYTGEITKWSELQ